MQLTVGLASHQADPSASVGGEHLPSATGAQTALSSGQGHAVPQGVSAALTRAVRFIKAAWHAPGSRSPPQKSLWELVWCSC